MDLGDVVTDNTKESKVKLGDTGVQITKSISKQILTLNAKVLASHDTMHFQGKVKSKLMPRFDFHSFSCQLGI